MNFQFYAEKLNSSEEFKKFISENPDAFFCSAFFIIDKESDLKDIGKKDKQHIDFYVPSKKKAFSFQLENNSELVPVQNAYDEAPEKIDLSIEIDFEEVVKLIMLHMEKENIKNKVQQILLSLQRKNGKDFILGTVFISGFGLIKFTLSVKEMKILQFEKKSFLDMLKIIRKK